MKLPGTTEESTANTQNASNSGMRPNITSAAGATGTEREARGGGGPRTGDDFSEFLWMEHEEEYNAEVIKELEEEEMMNYYLDQFEASIEAGIENDHCVPPPPSSQYQFQYMNGSEIRNGGGGSGTTSGSNSASTNHFSLIENQLVSQVNHSLALDSPNFSFNPDAAEFVPSSLRNSSTASGPPSSDSSANSASSDLTHKLPPSS